MDQHLTAYCPVVTILSEVQHKDLQCRKQKKVRKENDLRVPRPA